MLARAMIMGVAVAMGASACQGSGSPAQGDSAAADTLSAAPAAARPPAADTAALVSVEWSLTELAGLTLDSAITARPPTLRIARTDTTARVSGFAGCNRYSGQARLAGSELSFGPLMSTKMACPDRMEIEPRFLAMLDSTRQFRVSAGELELLVDGRRLARFKAP